LAWLRSIAVRVAPEAFGGLGGAAGLAPVVVAAVAVLTMTTGDAPAPVQHAPVHAVTRSIAVTPHALAPPVPTERIAADPPAAVIGRTGEVVIEARSTTALREGDVPTPIAPPEKVEPLEQVVGDISDVLAAEVAPPTPIGTAAVSETLGTVEQLGQQIATTTESLAGGTAQLLDGVDQTVVSVLQTSGADQLAATVEPVLGTATDVVTTGIAEPVAELVADTTVATTAAVTDTTSSLLTLAARH